MSLKATRNPRSLHRPLSVHPTSRRVRRPPGPPSPPLLLLLCGLFLRPQRHLGAAPSWGSGGGGGGGREALSRVRVSGLGTGAPGRGPRVGAGVGGPARCGRGVEGGWAPVSPSLALERPSRPLEPCPAAFAAPLVPGAPRASARGCEAPGRRACERLGRRSPTATRSQAFGVSGPPFAKLGNFEEGRMAPF